MKRKRKRDREKEALGEGDSGRRRIGTMERKSEKGIRVDIIHQPHGLEHFEASKLRQFLLGNQPESRCRATLPNHDSRAATPLP